MFDIQSFPEQASPPATVRDNPRRSLKQCVSHHVAPGILASLASGFRSLLPIAAVANWCR